MRQQIKDAFSFYFLIPVRTAASRRPPLPAQRAGLTVLSLPTAQKAVGQKERGACIGRVQQTNPQLSLPRVLVRRRWYVTNVSVNHFPAET